MSIDVLHEKIRKLKNPSMVRLGLSPSVLPPRFENAVSYHRALLEGLRGIVPAVRFSFSEFALAGKLDDLSALMSYAGSLGYYVLLDAPDGAPEQAAQVLLGTDAYPCDGVTVTPYIGSDAIKPFLPYCRDGKKDIFVLLRSANRSASELQDLLTGTRLIHQAAADIVSRLGEGCMAKCGYSRVAAVVSATSTGSIRNIRGNYRGMYLLVDGLDEPSGNHKNCSHAFDRMGYGAVVCAGESVTGAWKEPDAVGEPIDCARQAAERMRNNLTRYVKIL